ncbi:nuclear pore glycoprotein p62 isoform X2 [Strongylocentrotus purpuratus]|uniref:Nucleoporin NSP1-like C-terminal domain-containing protein n=1 Tax=Strongylocentrotus purpuratus TaxID=7668 RepID=A0A7M7NIZ4_STRPU|nr:nuclear pore glycoprotein p62 isoform X2 [Strongylocentrotus purpuratus]
MFGKQPTAQGAPATTGLFGSQAAPTAQPGGGFAFGGTAPAQAPGSVSSGAFGFGQPQTGQPAAASGGFSFGATPSQPQQTQATSSFSFNSNTAAGGGAAGGFKFGEAPKQPTAPTATATATGGFAFGTAAATPASTAALNVAKPSGFSTMGTASAGFGGTAPASTQPQQPVTGLSLASTAKPATPASGFPFGATAPVSAQSQQPSTGFSLATPGAGGFAFGANPSGAAAAPPASTAALSVAKPGFSLAGLSAGTASTAAIAQPNQTATSTPAAGGLGGGLGGGIKLGGFAAPTATPQSTAAASTGLKLGTMTASAPTGGLTLSAGTTSTPGIGGGLKIGGGLGIKPTGTGLTLGTPASSAATTSSSGLGLLGHKPATATTTGAGLALGVKATAATGATGPAETMSYRELEESINKWTVELEEQEKSFLHQAAQVNAWDRTLVVNGEKITLLHNDLEKVKADQQRLEHECDYIVAQQRELEDILSPLEDACKTQEGSLYRQHTDVERERTYQMSENIDSQLKRMVQDLKEIIDHMNTSNTTMDQTDPVNQVAKILNAHMNSLQWIDQNTGLVQRKVDEVTRQYEMIKRDQERNVHLAFE